MSGRQRGNFYKMLGSTGVNKHTLINAHYKLQLQTNVHNHSNTLLKMGCMGIPFWGVQVTLAVPLRMGCFHFT